jgi:hypothetical protein
MNVADRRRFWMRLGAEHRRSPNGWMVVRVMIVATAFLMVGNASYADKTADERQDECASLTGMLPEELAAAMTDLALPDQASPAGIYEPRNETGRLSKWTKDPRILVLGEGPVPSRFLDTIQKFADDLLRLGYSGTSVKIDMSASEAPMNGDLVVALTPKLRGFRKQASEAYYDLLVSAYGSEEALVTAHDRHRRNLDAGFVDVIGDGKSNVQRVVVALDIIGPPAIRDPQLFELLTTAMNPNPGNLLSSEKVYAKIWETQIYYALRWTVFAELYLSLLRNNEIRSGLDRSELQATIAEMWAREGTRQELLANLECQ